MKTFDSSNGVTYQFHGNRMIEMPKLSAHDEATNAQPVGLFDAAANALDESLAAASATKADPTLSEIGKASKIEPITAKAFTTIAGAWAGVNDYEKYIDKREADLLAVPALHATHSALAAQEAELRAWWRGMDMAERGKLLTRMEDEPGLEPLLLALIRGPGPLMVLDREVKAAKDLWDRSARLNNPGEAVRIGSGRTAVDWARRGLSHLGGMAMTAFQKDRSTVLRTLLEFRNERFEHGAGVYGIAAETVAALKNELAARHTLRAAVRAA